MFPVDDVFMITRTQPPRYLVWDVVNSIVNERILFIQVIY